MPVMVGSPANPVIRAARPDIAERRRSLGISVQKFCTLTALSVSQIERIERGGPARQEELARVERALSALEECHMALRLALATDLIRAATEKGGEGR